MDKFTAREQAVAAVQKAIEKAGTKTAFAAALNRPHQFVDSWLSTGLPARYCVKTERLFGISRKELRPADWADYWPELAEAA